MQLAGKIAIITGCSRGIGPYIAREMVAQGAAVTITARTEAPLIALQQELERAGGRVLAIAADATVPDSQQDLIEQTCSQLGGLDILINNAGVEPTGDFLHQSPEEIAHAVTTNVTAPYQLTRRVLPRLVAQKSGHIVTLSSIAGKKGAPYDAVYSGTKAALLAWSEALRAELAGSGVGVSAICPGYVTGVGMFAKFGVKPPLLLGSTTPQKVARGVIAAIQRDDPERVINDMPLRPFFALNALSPRLGGWLMRAIGVTALQKRKSTLL